MEMMRNLYSILNLPLMNVRDVSVTPMLLLQVITILLVTYIFSRIIRHTLYNKVFSRTRISSGVQASISRVLHYVLMVVGALISLQHLGIDLTALAALSAVLMVGIGFGLQNIASNFISGLILIFERPIQVGDFVKVQDNVGKVTAINARSTIVDTLDNVSIIIPNSMFISDRVINWSYKDARTRIHVRVRVAYQTDLDLARDTLLEVASVHPEVLEDPEPKVQFYEISDSAFNLDLLPWIANPAREAWIRNELNFAIVRAFKENGILIPYPQQDLHVRSVVPVETSVMYNEGMK